MLEERGRAARPARAGTPCSPALAYPVPSAVDASCSRCEELYELPVVALALDLPHPSEGRRVAGAESAMERGRFTPWAYRDDYRVRPDVPGCVALRVHRPRGS